MKTWQELGNLAFYPQLGHANRSNFFFYFNTLLSDYERDGNPKYREYANKTGKAAQQMLLSGAPSPKNNQIWLNNYKIIIDHVKQGIINERNNEIAFFNDKLKKFEETFTPEERKNSPELKSIYSLLKENSEQFDYINFTTEINILLQGYNNTKELFSTENKRLQELDKALNTLKERRRSQLEGYYKKYPPKDGIQTNDKIEASIKKFETARVNLYLKEKRLVELRGYKTHFKNVTKTADVIIGNWITNTLNTIFDSPDFSKKALEICKKHLIQDEETISKKLKAYIIRTMSGWAIENMDQILSGVISSMSVEDILKELDKDFDTLVDIQFDGLYENFGQFGHHLKYFEDSITALKNGKKSSEDLYETFSDFLKNIKKKKESERTPDEEVVLKLIGRGRRGKNNLSSTIELVDKLDNLLAKAERTARKQERELRRAPENNQSERISLNLDKDNTLHIQIVNGEVKIENMEVLKKVESFRALGDSRLRAKDLKGLVRGLKARTSSKLRDTIDTVIKTEEKTDTNKEIKESIAKVLQNLVISVGGATESEIKQGVQQALNQGFKGDISKWTGKLNLKNDFVTISGYCPINKIDTSFITKWQEKKYNEIMKQASEIQKQYHDDLIEALSQLEKDFSDEKKYNQFYAYGEQFSQIYKEYFELQEKITQLIDESIQEINSLNGDTKEKEELAQVLVERKRTFIEELKNSFYESSTMKTYNTYQNDIGFVGGSIGFGLLHQISNLWDIFSAAGVPSDNKSMTWLISAILNTSPISVVKEKNRDILENYLGSLALFALFSEGETEMQLIHQSLEQNMDIQKANNVPKIFHLYSLDGIYYPGSYVLSTVLVDLEKMYNILSGASKEVMAPGNIKITNDVSFSMIPNQRISGNEKHNSNLPTDTNPWQTVSNDAIANVNLNIVFMGGLLDIVKQLQDRMNNIQMPK